VDEAHKFRNHRSQQFENLQIICKSGRENIGGIEGFEKKVVLISATPLNNKPEDIYYLISLFQDIRNSNLAETNLQKYFYPHIITIQNPYSTNTIDLKLFRIFLTDIRDKVVKDITIRRTRTDLRRMNAMQRTCIRARNYFPKVADPFANRI
jgi:hypothetical protein